MACTCPGRTRTAGEEGWRSGAIRATGLDGHSLRLKEPQKVQPAPDKLANPCRSRPEGADESSPGIHAWETSHPQHNPSRRDG